MTKEQIIQVLVVAVPLPAQGHLNQMLHLSHLVIQHGLPLHYISSPIHNRQAKHRVNTLTSQDLAKIQFHDIHTPPFASPSPDPNASTKYPLQLHPAFNATLAMREPVAAYLREMSTKFKRVIVIHDTAMSVVVQDVISIPNAESYALNCFSALFMASFNWKILGNLQEDSAMEHLKDLPTMAETVPQEALHFAALQIESLGYRSGDIFNTCRLMEGKYLDILQNSKDIGNRKIWAIGPILPTNRESTRRQHKCLEWLDKHDPNSVIYVSFGTTTSLSDEEIREVAKGLEDSKVKFLWVLRDADKGDIFSGEVRRGELPEGFEERTKEVGMVVRDWAPQPDILAHPSTGGFMSHCGWNSCVESVSMGVAMAAWPMHSDQPMNAELVTRVLKTGNLVKEWKREREVVEASTVENALKRLMGSEEGEEMRKRAEELGTAVREATQPGGASWVELNSFIRHISR